MKPFDLQIVAAGMCCAVGYSTSAASAAIRASMDHFVETQFIGLKGQPLIGAQLYETSCWGPARYLWMFEQVVNECLQQLPNFDFATTALLLLLPGAERPGNELAWIPQTQDQITYPFHACSRTFSAGKAGLGAALQYAREQLQQDGFIQQLMIVGVDSYFNPATINHYLRQDRLLHDDNSDGFIPGEGAGAIVVRRATETSAGLHITGLGMATEQATILQDELPNRAEGMSAAIRQALLESQSQLSHYQFQMGDITGEAYYFREMAHALTRCFDQVVKEFPHYTVASSLGETGAAIGPLLLAYLYAAMPLGNMGQCGVLHFSADAGERVVLTVNYRKFREE